MQPSGTFGTEPQGVELSALFRTIDFNDIDRIIVAVSGGSDSTALLVLLTEFVRDAGLAVQIVAATIDHGLRTEAADEASKVGELSRGLGVRHVIERWQGSKPVTGIAEAGRMARYRLLGEIARRRDARVVLVGHTLDDQIETVAMREQRGDGRGLAGIAPATLHEGVWFVRPLLSVRREALRNCLRQRGRAWIDDPSNRNLLAERVRTRAALSEGRDEWRRLGTRLQEVKREREATAAAAAVFIDGNAELVVPGLIRIARRSSEGRGSDLIAAFRALLAVVGGSPHEPSLESSAGALETLAAGKGARITLSRTLCHSGRDGIYLLREKRDLPTADLHSGEIWDGRYRVAGPACRVGPMDTMAAKADAEAFPCAGPASLVRAALAAEPRVLHDDTQPTSQRPAVRLDPVLAPWQVLLPSFDLPLANAIARLYRLPMFPQPPLCGLIERKP